MWTWGYFGIHKTRNPLLLAYLTETNFILILEHFKKAFNGKITYDRNHWWLKHSQECIPVYNLKHTIP